MPIPQGARRDQEVRDAWRVAALTYDELVAWYHKRMPVGEDFRDWDWCDTGGKIESGTYALIYSQGPKKILSVSLTRNPTPAAQIGADRSGPC